MSINDVKSTQQILLKARSGSHAYGLATETSDEDFRGVFYATRPQFYGLGHPDQVSDATNDEVYYELGRFVELLTKANPTALELLATDDDNILHRHPVMDALRVEDFLTKACKNTFAGYATTQIRKARGLNKKVRNPYDERRKTVEEFCYVITEGQSRPLLDWISISVMTLDKLALAKVANGRDLYAVYYDPTGTWSQGITGGERANDVKLSSVPKGEVCLAYLTFNKDGYSVYCRNHRDYWAWVEERNDVRYEGTLAHGQGYDAKNMMHTIRLLDQAIGIFREGRLTVRHPDRAFLLEVKAGKFSLEEVLQMAEKRLAMLEELTKQSSLPDAVDVSKAEETLIAMREQLYR